MYFSGSVTQPLRIVPSCLFASTRWSSPVTGFTFTAPRRDMAACSVCRCGVLWSVWLETTSASRTSQGSAAPPPHRLALLCDREAWLVEPSADNAKERYGVTVCISQYRAPCPPPPLCAAPCCTASACRAVVLEATTRNWSCGGIATILLCASVCAVDKPLLGLHPARQLATFRLPSLWRRAAQRLGRRS